MFNYITEKSQLSGKDYSYTVRMYLFIANTCKDYERDSIEDFRVGRKVEAPTSYDVVFSSQRNNKAQLPSCNSSRTISPVKQV